MQCNAMREHHHLWKTGYFKEQIPVWRRTPRLGGKKCDAQCMDGDFVFNVQGNNSTKKNQL